ncbi:MAG TPA: hypothetical protein PLN33_18145 [Hyphomonadaceae bacterium]|nr:hypothetical protein [Hyphomonadaceae bacterium]
MRLFLAASAILLATSTFAAAPARAQQGGTYMWCTAWTEAPAEKAYYYSAFFAAGAWEAERKAFAFKVEIEKTSASKVKTTCMPPAEYDMAVATRNAAMKGAPGKVLSWAG